MLDLWGDLESFSRNPLKDGVHKYAEAAEIMLWSWAEGDGQIFVWDLMNKSVHWEDELSGLWESKPTSGAIPPELVMPLMNEETLVWFQNGGMFDFVILEVCKPGIAKMIDKHRRRDTMVQAFCHSLPGALDKMGHALSLIENDRKGRRGKALIHLFCKPQGEDFVKKFGTDRASKQTHPKEWQEFIEYAGGDIVTMRAAHKKMPMWNYKGREIDLWNLDLTINARGFHIDQEHARAAIRNSDRAKAKLATRAQALTGYNPETGEGVASTQQRDKVKQILAMWGVDLPDLLADTIERRLSDPDLPDAAKELMQNRLQASMNSVAKYKTVLRAVCADGRIRGGAQFRGAARTGRWAHRLFQHGNTPRPTIGHVMVELLIEMLKTDDAELVWDDIMEVCRSAVRGVIVAAPGKKLVVSDLANIEGRVAAWAAGEGWKVAAFVAYDNGEGVDLYLVAYGAAFNIDPRLIDKNTMEGYAQRQIGKVCIAEGQLVLTDIGLVPIESVTTAMRVWDGVEWVRHEGVTFSGMKGVIMYDGLTATPDHKVWIHGSTQPVPLEQAATSGSRLIESGSDRCPIRVVGGDVAHPSLHPRLGQRVRSRSVHRVRQRAVDCVFELVARFEQCLQRLWTRASNTRVALAAHSASTAALYQPQEPRLEELRGAWHSFQLRLRDSARGLHDREVRATRPIDGDRQEEQRRALRAGQPALGDQATKPTQHPKVTAVYDIVNAGPRRRFTVSGKLVSNCELMFQYGGGVGAWITGAATYGIDLDAMTEAVYPTLPEWAVEAATEYLKHLYEASAKRYAKRIEKGMPVEEAGVLLDQEQEKKRLGLAPKVFVACDAIKRLWRRAHPEISSYWKELEDCFRTAFANKGQTFECRKVKMRSDGGWVRIALPSGRCLCYPSVAIGKRVKDPDPSVDEELLRGDEISYAGFNQYTRQWGRVGTYGGKLFENIVQAIACDQLAYPMFAIEEAGYPIVAHIHDEVICETPDEPQYTAEKLAEMMTMNLGWNVGLPLSAAGWQGHRFHKES